MTDKGVNKWQQSRAGSSDTMCYKWDDDHEDDDDDDDDDDDEHKTFDIWDYGWIDFYREFYRDKYDIDTIVGNKPTRICRLAAQCFDWTSCLSV